MIKLIHFGHSTASHIWLPLRTLKCIKEKRKGKKSKCLHLMHPSPWVCCMCSMCWVHTIGQAGWLLQCHHHHQHVSRSDQVPARYVQVCSVQQQLGLKPAPRSISACSSLRAACSSIPGTVLRFPNAQCLALYANRSLTQCTACVQTFGWFVQYGTQPISEHVLVFWVGPLLGGLLAGLTWKLCVEAKAGQPPSNQVPVEAHQGPEQPRNSLKKTD